MKKILAVLLSLVMAFTFMMPAFATEEAAEDSSLSDSVGSVVDSAENIRDSFESEDYAGVVEGVFDFAQNLFIAIHDLVHALSEMFDFDCPFCDEDKDINADADTDADVDADLTMPEDLYETAEAVIGEAFAGKDMVFNQPYPQNVDAAYVFRVPTNSIVLDGIATANVKSAVVLAEGAVTGKLVFEDTRVGNYFHNVEGFKILHNYSGQPVVIELNGEVKVGSTIITADNIGDYIVGPYTVA